MPVTYIGHPLSNRVRPALTKDEFFRKHNIPPDRPLVAVLPGSRRSEAMRHLPELIRAAELLHAQTPSTFLLPASPTCGSGFFAPALTGSKVRVIEGEAWDTMAHCDVAWAASGTVTVEAALLGAPMVTFYKVKQLSWEIGKHLVKVPFFCMVNLIAEKKVVPELMQEAMTGAALAAEAGTLLREPAIRAKMKAGLDEVAAKLRGPGDAIDRAATVIKTFWEARN